MATLFELTRIATEIDLRDRQVTGRLEFLLPTGVRIEVVCGGDALGAIEAALTFEEPAPVPREARRAPSVAVAAGAGEDDYEPPRDSPEEENPADDGAVEPSPARDVDDEGLRSL